MDIESSSQLGHLHEGFVAMEYYALILNRSFLIFITDEGLRGWKFRGPVNARFPRSYETIELFLDSPEMIPGAEFFEELMREPGSFLIPYSSIKSIEFVGKRKWGMGPIPHAGILTIRLTEGRRREFILLGAANGSAIRDCILAKSGMGCSG